MKKDEKEQDKLLKVGEVAKILDIGKSKAYEIVTSIGFPVVKIGRLIRVRRSDLDQWIEENKA